MKVSKVGGPEGPQATRKKSKTGKTDETFADNLKETHAPENVAHVVDSSAIGGVESILSMQEVPDATEERARAILKQYGDDLLTRLEDLRHGILAGVYSKEKLTELAQRLRQKRTDSNDPRLNEIIDEIELRAEVEIAKLARKT